MAPGPARRLLSGAAVALAVGRGPAPGALPCRAHQGTPAAVAHARLCRAIERGAESWGFDLDEVHIDSDGRPRRSPRSRASSTIAAGCHGARGGRQRRTCHSAARCARRDLHHRRGRTALVGRQRPPPRGTHDAHRSRRRRHDTRHWPTSPSRPSSCSVSPTPVSSPSARADLLPSSREHSLVRSLRCEVKTSRPAVGRVDFAWVELGVFLEIDGKVKYLDHPSRRRDASRVPAAREAAGGARSASSPVGCASASPGRTWPTPTPGPPDPAVCWRPVAPACLTAYSRAFLPLRGGCNPQNVRITRLTG